MEWSLRLSADKSNDAGSPINAPSLTWLLPAMMFLSSAAVRSQEIPRPSLARQRYAAPAPSGSNLKIGQLHFNADLALNTEYVDNINLTSVDPLSDFIITPELGITGTWRATTLNVLSLQSTLSFAKYLEHSQFDQQNLTISPDSALSFKLYTGDLRIELHDYFSLKNETRDEGTLSGIASLPRFENTAGIGLFWDWNNVTLAIGYDHYNFITLGSALFGDGTVSEDLSRLDHSTDQVSTSVLVRLNSALLAGVEATASYTNYPDESVTDFSAFSVGPFFKAQITSYTSVQASAGVKGYSDDGNDSQFVAPSSGDGGTNLGYYANLGILHRLNRYYTDRLDFGHEDEVESLSGRTKTNYIRYSGDWMAGSRLSVGINLFLDDITQEAGGPLGLPVSSDYRRYGAALSVTYHLTSKSNVGLIYQFTKQDTDTPISSYDQSRVALRFGYRF